MYANGSAPVVSRELTSWLPILGMMVLALKSLPIKKSGNQSSKELCKLINRLAYKINNRRECGGDQYISLV